MLPFGKARGGGSGKLGEAGVEREIREVVGDKRLPNCGVRIRKWEG